MLAEPRPRWTPNTITDAQALREELDMVRRTGLAVNRGESHSSYFGLAAPVTERTGRPIAALSIAGPPDAFRTGQPEAGLRRIAYAASQAAAREETLTA